jgi:hypothetical protein
MISRFFGFSSKPGLCPESQCSPIIDAGQEIFPWKTGGGDKSRTARDAGEVERTFRFRRIAHYQP